ncbi:GNAT family N-acetyltransferase [Leifsonia sp. EB34]|uniref:GNAT family N-acetyltransferase n=1 Tax=Leifsonia sp. EB34 TaxID=3156303 RepID=UPI003512401A
MRALVDRVRGGGAAALEPAVVAATRRTNRLVLRPYRMSDLGCWLAIEADEAVRKPLHWPERTTSEARAHLRARTRHTILRSAGSLLVLAVEYESRVIGDVSIHLRTVAPATRSVEVGWLLRSDYRRRGLATEAAGELLRLAFNDVNANLVTAVISSANEASARLARRLGFQLAARVAGYDTYLLSREAHDRPVASPRSESGAPSRSGEPSSWNERRAG